MGPVQLGSPYMRIYGPENECVGENGKKKERKRKYNKQSIKEHEGQESIRTYKAYNHIKQKKTNKANQEQGTSN